MGDLSVLLTPVPNDAVELLGSARRSPRPPYNYLECRQVKEGRHCGADQDITAYGAENSVSRDGL
jgi:hypothetical protein